MIAKIYLSESHRLIVVIVSICIILFLIVAILESYYVGLQTKRETLTQLEYSAQEVNQAINYVDHWNVQKYRQTAITAPHYYVFDSDGQIIDIEGFIPNLIPFQVYPMVLESGKTQFFRTRTGDIWRLLSKSVKGGSVVLGIFNSEDTMKDDKKLISCALKFDNLTVDESVRLPAREISEDVEFAIIDSLSALLRQWGGVPFELDKNIFKSLLHDSIFQKDIGDIEYLALAKPVVNQSDGKIAGLILVSIDITLRQQALRAEKTFIFIFAGILFFGVIIIFISLLIVQERQKRKRRVPVDKALNSNEDVTLEFKETLEYVDKESLQAIGVPADKLNDVLSQKQRDVLHSSLKTICAFLNTNGGTLFIGVTDKKPRVVKGIERDLKLCGKQNEDGLELKLRDYLRTRFHSSPLGKTDIRFETFEGKEVCVIDVQPASKKEPVDLEGKFYVRDGGRTLELSGQLLADWLKERLRG
ncbi:MAG: ATP-binding protein [Bacteroidota bacterium]